MGQPFDVVKVRYQTPEYAGRYSSVIGAFGESSYGLCGELSPKRQGSIVREERVAGLFKGVMSPMVSPAP